MIIITLSQIRNLPQNIFEKLYGEYLQIQCFDLFLSSQNSIYNQYKYDIY